MGRSLIANEPCQICGDRSFGRHYGLWTCDGCSCFFKRSIRRNIKYTCISGENNCPIDKTRRNWCPACRLKKCLDMQMNKNAVQKERGPRKKKNLISTVYTNNDFKLSNPSLFHINSESDSSCQSSIIEKPASTQIIHEPSRKDTFLMSALINSLKSSVIIFLPKESKQKILEQLWPVLIILQSTNDHEMINTLNNISEIKDLYQIIGEKTILDVEEIRLLTCILLCNYGKKLSLLNFSTTLHSAYNCWLLKHLINYHKNDQTRFLRLNQFVNSLSTIHIETIIDQLKNIFSIDPFIAIHFLNL